MKALVLSRFACYCLYMAVSLVCSVTSISYLLYWLCINKPFSIVLEYEDRIIDVVLRHIFTLAFFILPKINFSIAQNIVTFILLLGYCKDNYPCILYLFETTVLNFCVRNVVFLLKIPHLNAYPSGQILLIQSFCLLRKSITFLVWVRCVGKTCWPETWTGCSNSSPRNTMCSQSHGVYLQSKSQRNTYLSKVKSKSKGTALCMILLC